MLYLNFLRKLNHCTFCKLDKKEIIKENKHAYLRLSRAPYSKDHLLVFPKKHELDLSNLSEEEQLDIQKLVFLGLKQLRKKHKRVSIIYREGDLGAQGVGKSVDHLHINLIPNVKAGLMDGQDQRREYMNHKTLVSATKKIKKELF